MKSTTLLFLCFGLLTGCQENPPIPAPTVPIVSLEKVSTLGTGQQIPYSTSRVLLPNDQTGGYFLAFNHVPYDADLNSDEALRYQDVSLAEYDADGNQRWSREVKKGDYYGALQLMRTSGGDFVISGARTQSPTLGGLDTPWSMRLNASGQVIWDKALSDVRGEALGCTELDNGNLAFLRTEPGAARQVLTITDPSGQLLLDHDIGEGFSGLKAFSDHGILLYGERLLMLNEESLEPSWTLLDTLYQGFEQTFFMEVEAGPEHGFVALGRRERNQVLANTVIMNISADGEKQDEIIIDQLDEDLPVSFSPWGNQGWIVLTRKELFRTSAPKSSVLMLAVDKFGEIIWSKELRQNTLGFEWGISVVGLPGNRFVYYTIGGHEYPRGFERTLAQHKVLMPE